MTERSDGKTRWRSLADLADSPEFREFAEAEFPGEASRLDTRASRREFLKLMGASVALAGLAGCRWPEEEIVPFAGRPEGVIPGVPKYFATSMEVAGVATGLLARSYDGRPIKLEGNPEHPASLGASDHLAQANVLSLYDPDRSMRVIERVGNEPRVRSWGEFEAFAKARLGGKGLRVLAEASSSPLLARMRREMLAADPTARWIEYEPFSMENESEGLRWLLATDGDDRAYRVRLALDSADLIVCLDADPLGAHPAAVRNARDFASGRRGENGRMNRLYAIESALSLTGAMADERHPAPTHRLPVLAGQLAAELARGGLALPGLADAISTFGKVGETPRFVTDLAREILAGRRDRTVLLAGAGLPAATHALVEAVNAALGSRAREVRVGVSGTPSVAALADLAGELKRGEVSNLLILGGNPAYDAPADLDLARKLGKAGTIVHLGLHRDETARLATWHLPRTHALETWGDAVSWDGTHTLSQPLIAPLYAGRTPAEVLALVLGGAKTGGRDLLREAWTDEASWRRALHDGFTGDVSEAVGAARAARGTEEWGGILRESYDAARTAKDLEIVFVRDHRVHDGRYANNGWLQELPDPLTKLTWGNAALIGPATAGSLGIESGDVVRISRPGRVVEIPALVLPGVATGSVILAAGYGRPHAGNLGSGVGVDVYPLRTTDSLHVATDATIRKTGARVALATTQDHHAVDAAAAWGKKTLDPRLYREATLEEFTKDPEFAKHAVHHPELKSLWEEKDYSEGHRWGMAIDLSVCTGCSACTIACQAENNIPVVGEDEVKVGRAMHWIRVDRTFAGDPENPDVGHQPVACQHCEHAPCEQVCPVAATVHSDEGLNDMVYNRCVGTRYCSNNCPYKVRRFNWFLNHRDQTEVQKMVMNPEVTVRSRGVMEKCTYCVQRIQAVKIAAKKEGRPIEDGEVVPACMQACPAGAISFGDLNDPASKVREDHEDPRAYGMLAELNVKPRTAYLGKLRNPSRPGGGR